MQLLFGKTEMRRYSDLCFSGRCFDERLTQVVDNPKVRSWKLDMASIYTQESDV